MMKRAKQKQCQEKILIGSYSVWLFTFEMVNL